MVEIEQINNIVSGIGTQSLPGLAYEFTKTIDSLDTLTNDPVILDLLSQIYFIIGELGKITN